jgi:hypothetical protein
MKHWLSLALAVCVLLPLFCVAAVGAEADQINTWSVYVMEETENGLPVFKDPPAYECTEKGLSVAPSKGLSGFTVQSDVPYSLDEGFFLEVEVEDILLESVLMLHLWNQSGVLIGNYNCGSGWYGMIAVDKTGNDYMMSLTVTEASGQSDGTMDILGSMKVKTSINDQSGTYTLAVSDGVLRVNGSVVSGMDQAIAFLREKCRDEKVYVGVSLMDMQDVGQLPALTVTRFGKDEATATVPGANQSPGASETAEPETNPAEGLESDTEANSEAAPAVPDPGETTDSATESEAETVAETLPLWESSDILPDDDEDREGNDGYEEPEESNTTSTLDKLKDVYGVASTQCHSTIGPSGLIYVAIISACGFLMRKKRS